MFPNFLFEPYLEEPLNSIDLNVGSEFFNFSRTPTKNEDVVVDNWMHVPNDSMVLENFRSTTSDTILFSEIWRIVGAQLVTLSFSLNH